MLEPLHHGVKSLFDLFLSSSGDAAQSSPVEGVERGNNLKAAGLRTVLSRKLEQAFIGFGTAVREEDFAIRHLPVCKESGKVLCELGLQRCKWREISEIEMKMIR